MSSPKQNKKIRSTGAKDREPTFPGPAASETRREDIETEASRLRSSEAEIEGNEQIANEMNPRRTASNQEPMTNDLPKS